MSSSLPDARIADLVERSLEGLRNELPTAYHSLCRRVGRRTIEARIDDEVVFIRGEPLRVLVVAQLSEPDVRIRTSRKTILALLDAESTLYEAVASDRIEVVGDVDDLISLHEALLVYVKGGVRCPSFAPLLDELRRWTSGQEGSTIPFISVRIVWRT